jgi:sRNA-binding protein
MVHEFQLTKKNHLPKMGGGKKCTKQNLRKQTISKVDNGESFRVKVGKDKMNTTM